MLRIFLLSLIGLAFNFQILAQCCAAGNPSSDGGSLGLPKNSLSLSASFIHSYSDTYFIGNQVSDENYWKSSKFDFSLVAINYGLTEKIQISTEIGYFIDKMNHNLVAISDTIINKKASGLGDATIGIQYHLFSNKQQMLNIAPMVKLTLPVGQFDQMDGNIVLPIDIQPSSGSYKLNTSLLITKGFFGSKFSASSFLSAEFSQEINTDRTNHKYGNLYTASFNVNHKTSDKLSTGLGLNYQHRKKAINSGNIIEASGGTYIRVQPKISYYLKNNYSINTAINIPIYRYVNDYQLTNKYNFVFGINKSFDLKSMKSQVDYNILEALNEQTLFVDGICGMCKDRIETIAYKVKNIKWAEWDLESKSLLLKYEKEFDLNKLARKLSKAGHDNAILKAEDQAYNNLHSCCKYRSINNH